MDKCFHALKILCTPLLYHLIHKCVHYTLIITNKLQNIVRNTERSSSQFHVKQVQQQTPNLRLKLTTRFALQ